MASPVFHEVQFPVNISYGSTGGPRRKTEIVTLVSGHEERNTPWSQSRRTYNVAYGLKDLDQLHSVIEFFEARMGQLHGFRYKDFSDFKSCAPLKEISSGDQILGVGNGTQRDFQLVKTYSSGPSNTVREIKKPVEDTVVCAWDGRDIATFSINYASGMITFQSAPPPGQTVTAGFEFDVPVRFEIDTLTVNTSHFEHGSIPDINLIEVRI